MVNPAKEAMWLKIINAKHFNSYATIIISGRPRACVYVYRATGDDSCIAIETFGITYLVQSRTSVVLH